MKNLLTVLFAALALLVAPAATMGQDDWRELNDSQEPGSVLVFPKFLRGRVTTPDQGVLPTTEIEISATCPRGATCTDGQVVIIRAHWVCPAALIGGVPFTPCRETDFTVRTTVRGSLFFNPEGIGPANATVPVAPCSGGYLIAWVVDNQGRPIKFDGLIGDAIIREAPEAAGAYNAIPIQAVSALANNALVSLGESGALVFDGLDGHYKAVTGTVIGTVRYNRVTPAPLITSLTLLTLDVRSNDFNFPTIVDLDFFTAGEQLLSTSTAFVCWNEIPLNAIDPNLVETFMGRKGLVQSTEAEKVAIFGIDDKTGPVTLIALIDTKEFTLLPSGAPTQTRGYIYSTYNDSRPVPTSFVPR
jgi:hypothetical protein